MAFFGTIFDGVASVFTGGSSKLLDNNFKEKVEDENYFSHDEDVIISL